jgi:hypothetical protein
MNSAPRMDVALPPSASAPSISVEDYICRGEELGHYGLYQLSMWSTAMTMSFEEWTRYLSATRVPSSVAQAPPGQQSVGDR